MCSSLPTIKFVSAMGTFPKPVLSVALSTSLCPGGKRRLWVPWGGFLCSLLISGRGDPKWSYVLWGLSGSSPAPLLLFPGT